MFTKISRIILRNRAIIIVLLSLFTAYMAYEAQSVKLSYENTALLGAKDSAMVEYKKFKDQYGEDGTVLMLGIKNPEIFKLEQFNAWYDLGNDIRKIDGVEDVISMTRGLNLIKNEATHQFDYFPLVKHRPTSQHEVDSLKNTLLGLKFYEGMLFNRKTNAALMAITLNKNILVDQRRIALVGNIVKAATAFEQKNKTIPEEEFLHFVLPLRVNNENLDNFREVMYPEIKERIKGLGMKEAALEINHW